MRITTSYKVAGTKSFRLASAKLFGHYGGNLQNCPESLYCCLTADKDRIIVSRDQSGAEALIVAYEANDGNFRQLFLNGIKPHVYMALQRFIDHFRGDYPRERYEFKTPAELKALPEWPELNSRIKHDAIRYYIGKKIIHMKNYDAKWPTYQLDVLRESSGAVVISDAEAKKDLLMHETIFPEIKEQQGRLLAKVKEERRLNNLFGYPRVFYGRWDGEMQRDALSWIPQSTVGCITHIAIHEINLYAERNDKKWDLLLNLHDAFKYQVPLDDVEEFLEISKKAIERELTSTTGNCFRMRSEAQIGKNLGHYDEKTNPEGLKDVIEQS